MSEPTDLDLEACAREPIHVPGSIQPHGALLALAADGRAVEAASESCVEHLGVPAAELIGQPLSALFEGADLDAVTDAVRRGPRRPELVRVRARRGEGAVPFDALVHLADGRAVVELEPPRPAAVPDYFGLLARTVATLATPGGIVELCERAAAEVARLTGFERVMVYRFEEDWSGTVVAETRADAGVDSYLEHRFPASDIPEQARRLYELNPIRIIPDALYRPSPIAMREAGASLDLTFAALRSVSPVHLEYLRNMGVRASMSISLLRDGRLWGLVACHHRAPLYLPFETRTACELISSTLSLEISNLERAEAAARRARAQQRLASLREVLAQASEPVEAIADAQPPLHELVRAAGAAVWLGTERRLVGRTPPEEFLARLVEWLGSEPRGDIFATDSLPRMWTPAAEHRHVASGLLAAAISSPPGSWLLWFRPEVVATVRWRGDPRNPALLGTDNRLHPRASFALWQETVRLTSEPWSADDLEVAASARDSYLRAVARRLEGLEKLAERLAEERVLAVRERDNILSAVSHDMRTPLATVRLTAELLLHGKAALPAEVVHKLARIDGAAGRMAVLVDEIVDEGRIIRGQPLSGERRPCDLVALARRKAEEFAQASPRHELRVETAFAAVTGEWDANALERVLDNLVGNAVKYSPEGGVVRILVDVAEDGRQAVVAVVDEGVGIPAEEIAAVFEPFRRASNVPGVAPGTGLGLAITRRIVEEHGGTIEVVSTEGAGSMFTVRLPRAPVQAGVEPRA